MMITQELAWLNTLQGDLAIRRDWVAVGHLQALIDHIAEMHVAVSENTFADGIEPMLH